MPRLEHFEEHYELNRNNYKKQLKLYQLRWTILQKELRNKQVPVMLIFEGQDASGKGGAIKRATETLDPRGLKVYPIGAPTEDELKHHYLWRFWSRIPRKGEIVIFDRSWYGRVMVERVEKFATKAEWSRAFQEINNFEKTQVNDGTILCKFFIHISKDEQLIRFNARKDDPFKSWKLTDEDWRNREKWDLYKEACEEMFDRTDTVDVPWNIIAGNNKLHSRIAVLKIITGAAEERLNVDRESLYPPAAQ